MNAPVRNIRLQANRHKLLEAILYLIAKGEADGRPLTQYQIVKSLFLADTAHLNAYGRPITFDNYAALEFGPVPVEAYDMLKPGYPWGKWFGLPQEPWERHQVSARAFEYCRPAREANLRALSKSDIKALTAALERVRELGFGGVRDETHEHPAYVEAWDRRGGARSAPMTYAKLFDHPDEDLVADLAFASTHA